jgi:hypothetical protein
VPWQLVLAAIERKRRGGRRVTVHGIKHSPWIDRARALAGIALAVERGTPAYRVLALTDAQALAAVAGAPRASQDALRRWIEHRDGRWPGRDPCGCCWSPTGLAGPSGLLRRMRRFGPMVAAMLDGCAPGATLRDLLRSPRWPAEVAGA